MIMTEEDIEFLLKNKKWISVYPTRDGVWKACIYNKSKKNTWIIESSIKRKSPKECYDWIENKFLKLSEIN